MSAIDPITFAVIKSGLDTIVDDMAYAVMRTARSPIVRDVLDYSVTLCDAQGRILSHLMVPMESKICHGSRSPRECRVDRPRILGNHWRRLADSRKRGGLRWPRSRPGNTPIP